MSFQIFDVTGVSHTLSATAISRSEYFSETFREENVLIVSAEVSPFVGRAVKFLTTGQLEDSEFHPALLRYLYGYFGIPSFLPYYHQWLRMMVRRQTVITAISHLYTAEEIQDYTELELEVLAPFSPEIVRKQLRVPDAAKYFALRRMVANTFHLKLPNRGVVKIELLSDGMLLRDGKVVLTPITFARIGLVKPYENKVYLMSYTHLVYCWNVRKNTWTPVDVLCGNPSELALLVSKELQPTNLLGDEVVTESWDQNWQPINLTRTGKLFRIDAARVEASQVWVQFIDTPRPVRELRGDFMILSDLTLRPLSDPTRILASNVCTFITDSSVITYRQEIISYPARTVLNYLTKCTIPEVQAVAVDYTRRELKYMAHNGRTYTQSYY